MIVRGLLTAFLLSFLLVQPASGTQAAEHAERVAAQYWGRTFWSEDAAAEKSLVPELLSVLTLQLPEFQHHNQPMSLTRGFNDLLVRDDMCMVGMLQTPERDKIAEFVGLWPLVPPQLVIRRADWEKLAGSNNSLSLAQLLHRQDLRSATISGRYYGAEPDKLLAAAVARGQTQSLQTSNITNNLLTMLAHGRIDFTLDYIETYQLSLSSQPELAQKLMLLPMDEAQATHVAGIYCSRSPRGTAMIQQIERIAQDPAVLEDFQTLILHYLPAESRERYADWIKSYYTQRAQPLPTAPAP